MMSNKTERLQNHPHRVALYLMFQEALKHPEDGQWREYTGQVRQAGRLFEIVGKFVIRNKMFTFKDLKITALDRDRIVIQ